MKKHLCLRGVGLLLACILTFSFVSCGKVKNDAAKETEITRRLSVDVVDVFYDKDYKEAVAEDMAEVISRLVRIEFGVILGDERKASLRELLLKDYVSLFESEGVRTCELDGILSICRTLCAELEQREIDGPAREKIISFCSFYRDVVSLIGTERAAGVTYEGLRLYLEDKAEYYAAGYEKYGYLWYADSAKITQSRLDALVGEVGKQTFIDAMSVPIFAMSVMSGVFPTTDGAVSSMLYDGDVSAILKRQAEYFRSLDVTDYQWYVIGEAFCTFGGYTSETLLGASTSVLVESGMLSQFARCMPKLVKTYAAFAEKLDAERISVIRNADKQEMRLRTVCEAISECPDELYELLGVFEKYCATQSEAEYSIIERADMQDRYSSFSREYSPIDASTFAKAIRSFAAGEIDESELSRSALRYLSKTAPYFAFAIYADENIVE